MRMSRLYKRMLTVQVLLLGAHHLMSGGFADGSCYSRASHAVLSGGDPIRERLARHLHRPRLPPPLLQEIRGDGPAFTRTALAGAPGLACSLRSAALSSADPALAQPLGTSDAPSPVGPSRSRAVSRPQGSPCIVPRSHFPTPRSGHHIPASSPVKQHCPCNPIPWCKTRCASGLLRTPRPKAHTFRCPELQRVSQGCPQGRGHLFSVLGLRWQQRLVLLALHPHSRAAQNRGVPHPSRLGFERADSSGPTRPLACHRAVTRPPLPFSAPWDYPSNPRAPEQGRGPVRPSVLTPPQEHRSPDAARGSWVQARAALESPGRDAYSSGPAPVSAPRSPRSPPAAASASAAASL